MKSQPGKTSNRPEETPGKPEGARPAIGANQGESTGRRKQAETLPAMPQPGNRRTPDLRLWRSPYAPRRAFSSGVLRQIASRLSARFPVSLGTEPTQLALVDISPDCLHAYWDVNLASLATAQRKLGARSAQTVLNLRIYALTGGRGEPDTRLPYTDVRALGTRSQHYQKVQPGACGAGCQYVAEIGLLGQDGEFVPIKRSNVARLPTEQSPEAEAAQHRLTEPAVEQNPATTTEAGQTHSAVREEPKGGNSLALIEETGATENQNGVTYTGNCSSEVSGATADGSEEKPVFMETPQASPEPVVSAEFPAVEETPAPAGEPGPETDNSARAAAGTPNVSALGRLSASGQGAWEAAFSGTLGQPLKAIEGIKLCLVIRGQTIPGHALIFHGRGVQPEPDGSFEIRRPINPDLRWLEFFHWMAESERQAADLMGRESASEAVDNPATGGETVDGEEMDEEGSDKVFELLSRERHSRLFELHASLEVTGNPDELDAITLEFLKGLGCETPAPGAGKAAFYFLKPLPGGALIPPPILLAGHLTPELEDQV